MGRRKAWRRAMAWKSLAELESVAELESFRGLVSGWLSLTLAELGVSRAWRW